MYRHDAKSEALSMYPPSHHHHGHLRLCHKEIEEGYAALVEVSLWEERCMHMLCTHHAKTRSATHAVEARTRGSSRGANKRQDTKTCVYVIHKRTRPLSLRSTGRD